MRAARVSVHLDTVDQQLVHPDHTLPLQVEVEDATVFSNLGVRSTLACVPAWKARLRRLAGRTALHAAGAQRKGD
ncbi:hypothetical protein AB0941_31785 [Streptomyces sp. NPDC013433]|uniref:hypothetical protein n=1 Tax=Streptomyces sp. NPDC013433 TaxID=3155604 RepID=UPI00345381C7